MPHRPLAPIALFAYRRLDHLKRTLASLSQNPEAIRSQLFVFSDGAKGAADSEEVSAVRAYLATVTGFAGIEVIASPRNKGLAASIIDGVGRVLRDHESVIVVEDDLLVSPYFLAYMNDGLECYANDERVASIHAYVYPVGQPLPETFFLRGADCWGWATWGRAWRHFNPDGAALLAALRQRGLLHAFDYDGNVAFSEMLEAQIAGRNNSWAIRWHAACFLEGMFTLNPGHSLVSNIGNDGSGTHGAADVDAQYDGAMADKPPRVNRLAVAESATARNVIKEYFRRNRITPLRRRLVWLKQWFFRGAA